MRKAELMDLDYKLHFEPEGGINNPREFTDELLIWARKEDQDLVILEESMEPIVLLEGKQYRCRLGNPNLANGLLGKMPGMKGVRTPAGPFLGYKWVYLYEV